MRELLAVGVLAVLLSVGPTSHACTCSGPPGPERAEEAKVVFAGALESVVDHQKDYPSKKGAGLIEYRFRVGQVWKGQRTKAISVYSDNSSCGARFELGKLYFVCAFEKGGSNEVLLTNVCDSGPLEWALESRVGLEDPAIVDPEIAAIRPTEAELVALAGGDDPVLARFAAKALDTLQKQEKQGFGAK